MYPFSLLTFFLFPISFFNFLLYSSIFLLLLFSFIVLHFPLPRFSVLSFPPPACSTLIYMYMYCPSFQSPFSKFHFSIHWHRIACVANKTKPRYSPSANQQPKACFAPCVLPGFSIIGSNRLMHLAVLSCTVIGRVDLAEPWLCSWWIPDTQHKRGGRRRSWN